MIIIHGAVTARPECHADVLKLSLEHVRRSRTETGCISHNVSVDSEDNSRFVFVEHWQDMSAVQAHFALNESREFVASLTPLIIGAPVLKIYDANLLQG